MSKIVHIIPQLGTGGAEKFAVDLCNQLSASNEVHLIILNCFENGKNSFFKKNLCKSVHLYNLNKQIGFKVSCIFSLFKLLLIIKPDVVNTHLNALLYASFSILILPFKFYHTVHNIAEKEQTNMFLRWVYMYLFRCKYVVPVAISKVVQRSIYNVYELNFSPVILNGCVKSKITDKYDAVRKEINSYINDSNTKIFLSVARFSEQKNLNLLVKSFNELRSINCNVILIIIGDGDPKIKTDLLNLSGPSIIYLGNKSNVADYFSNCDVFCLSSMWEGLPITILEAFSFGLPVISTPVGGIPELINDNVTGLLSKNLKVASYLQCLEKFLSFTNEDLKIIEKKNKAIFKEKYSISICSNNYLKAYSQIFK